VADPLDDKWTPDGPVPCRNHPRLFFPPSTWEARDWDPEPAKAVCRTCPEVAACLTWAMTEERPPLGVWGGYQFKDGAPL
jgi:WhiB family redox-sensing transcriptional regulator